jgi:hypothetical protein
MGRVRRSESSTPVGEILADEDLERIVGGKSVRTSRRVGPARKPKKRLKRKGC